MDLSFITLSRDNVRLQQLHGSIRSVLGFEDEALANPFQWELLPQDGSRLDLFEGYNTGAAQAKGAVLVFLHDDLELLGNVGFLDTPLKLLRKPLTGFVGAAGSRAMPRSGCWWRVPELDLRGAMFHPGEGPFEMHLNGWPHQAAQFGPVAVLDGAFLMITRRNFDRLGGFDTETYSGFHFYDIDATFRASLLGLTNYAAPLHLLHHSHGKPNDNWEENRKKFLRKFDRDLPYRLPG